jgi:hypothetical protein
MQDYGIFILSRPGSFVLMFQREVKKLGGNCFPVSVEKFEKNWV